MKWGRPAKRWFQDTDGTFYRNIPLIMAEQREMLPLSPWSWRQRYWRELRAEWEQAWRDGLIRKEHLGPGDVVAEMAPFREAYPDKPGLWFLDEPGVSFGRGEGKSRPTAREK